MRSRKEITKDLVKINQDYIDWVDGILFDNVDHNKKRTEFFNRYRDIFSEMYEKDKFELDFIEEVKTLLSGMKLTISISSNSAEENDHA